MLIGHRWALSTGLEQQPLNYWTRGGVPKVRRCMEVFSLQRWQRETAAWWNMVGCLQAIRHGRLPGHAEAGLDFRPRGLVVPAYGGFGAGGGWATLQQDKSSRDCFQSFQNRHELSTEITHGNVNVLLTDIAFMHSVCILTSLYFHASESIYFACTCAGKLFACAREAYAWPSAPAVIPS